MNSCILYDWESFIRHCSSTYPSKVLTSSHLNLDGKIVKWSGFFLVQPPYFFLFYIMDHLNPLDTHCIEVNMTMKDICTYTVRDKEFVTFNIRINVKGLIFYALVIVLLSIICIFYLDDCTLNYTLVGSQEKAYPSLTFHFVQSLFSGEQISAPDFYFDNAFKVLFY